MKIETLEDLEYEIEKYRPITIGKMFSLLNRLAEQQIKTDLKNIEHLIATMEKINAVGKSK